MPRGVARGGEDHDAPVTEHVAIACQLLDRLRRREGRLHGLRHGPLVLGALDQDRGGGEERDVADVVAMRVRHGDVGNVGRLDPDLGELRRQRLGPTLGDGAIRHDHAVGHRGNGVGNAGVPEQQPLGVTDEIAVVRELDRLAFVDPGRPPRLVLADILSAVEHVEALEAARGSRQHRRPRESCHDGCQRNRSGPSHLGPPSGAVEKGLSLA